MSSINNIPVEIISCIFGFLDTTDLKNVRQVSKGWKAVVNETVGTSINVGSPNEYTSNLEEWTDVEIIDTIGIKHCIVGTLNDIDGPPFKYPEVVRSLSFIGPITHDSLMTMLCPLPALQHLSLHYTALEYVQLSPKMVITRLLKSIKISSQCITANRSRNGGILFTENVINLLLSLASIKLEKCILDLPFLPEFELDLLSAILGVTGCHNKTLKVLQVYFGVVFELRAKDMRKMKSSFTKEQMDRVNLGLSQGTTLTRVSFAGPKNLTQNDIWSKYFANQEKIQELFYMNDNLNINYGLSAISLNALTLTKLLFHVNALSANREAEELDCSAFSTCVNLTHLLIRGRPTIQRILHGGPPFNAVTFQVAHPKLVNLKALPKKLTLVSFRDIILTNVEISVLFTPGMEGLPALERLRLVETGGQEQNGIDGWQLLSMIGSKRLKEMEFLRSFNRKCFKEFAPLNFKDELIINYVVNYWNLHLVLKGAGYVRKEDGMFSYQIPDHHLRANDVCDVVFE